MIRRSRSLHVAVAGGALVALLVAGCGSAAETPSKTPSPATPSPTSTPHPASPTPASPSATASASLGPSGGSGPPAASGNPSAEPTLNLPHLDAALEAQLPSVAGGIPLQRYSVSLDAYLGSTTGGDKQLYAPWLVQLGTTADKVTLAVAVDLTDATTISITAIKVPGADPAKVSSTFVAAAKAAGWPTSPHTIGPKSVTQIIDPSVDATTGRGVAYVYSKGDVLYTVVTGDASLLLEALARLP